MKRKKGGFTLVELIVVIVIILVLAAVLVPRLKMPPLLMSAAKYFRLLPGLPLILPPREPLPHRS